MRVRPGSAVVRSVPRLLVVALVGGSAAACSSDAMRFGDNPFQNPFQNSARFEPGSTGSVQPAPQRQAQSYGAAPAGAVTSAPLAAHAASP